MNTAIESIPIAIAPNTIFGDGTNAAPRWRAMETAASAAAARPAVAAAVEEDLRRGHFRP